MLLESLRSNSFSDLLQYADVLGPIGLLDRKRLGVVVQKNCLDQICRVADSIREALDEDFLQIEVLSYPFALDGKLQEPNRAGTEQHLIFKSLQPLLALPTPLGKRTFDVAIASIGALVLLPLFLLSRC